MSTYDPAKVEDWVVSSIGFWRKDNVNETRWCVAFRGTWQQVHDRMNAMIAMERRHADEMDELREKHAEERKEFWPKL